MSDHTPGADLSPCPFCAARFVKSEKFSTRARDVFVHPNNKSDGYPCPGAAQLIPMDQPKTIAAWNRRPDKEREGLGDRADALSFFATNVDAWGAAEWFDRLASAIREQDKAVLAAHRAAPEDKILHEAAVDTFRMIAASSAMTLVRDHEDAIRNALSALSKGANAAGKNEQEPVAYRMRRKGFSTWSFFHPPAPFIAVANEYEVEPLFADPSSFQDERDAIWNEAVEACALHIEPSSLADDLRALKHSPKAGQGDAQ